MDVTQIPFNKLLGISKCATEQGLLMLPEAECYTNHLNTVHASAQFALGEAASGEYLLQRFKSISEAVIPVVRNVEIKFRKPGIGAITASANISDEAAADVVTSLERKGRAIIPVAVVVKDGSDDVTMTATYEWFVQKK